MVLSIDIPDEVISRVQAKSGKKIESAINDILKEFITRPINNIPNSFGSVTHNGNNMLSAPGGFANLDDQAKKLLEDMRKNQSKQPGPAPKKEMMHMTGSFIG